MTEADSLGSLLRSWRARVQPAEAGVARASAARRTPGLRREEVAWLAGVSTDYVKRLEQGRAHPSGAVLRALARVLRLSDAEYDLACRVAGYTAETGRAVPQHIGPSVRRMLDRLQDVPVAVFDATWTLLDYNLLWSALVGIAPPRGDRSVNLVRQYFTGGPGRVRHDSPETYRQSLVADLRTAAARYPLDRDLAGLITELRTASADFARCWDSAAVAHHGNQRKTVDHPRLGPLELDCDVLTVHGVDLRITVFTAAPDSEVADRIRLLAVLDAEEAIVPAQADRS